MGDSWLQHTYEVLSSDDVQGGGVFDLEGNPWAEKVSGFQVEKDEVALVARGFIDLERQQAEAEARAHRAALTQAQRETVALAVGTHDPDHPLSLLCGKTDVLNVIKREATVAAARPELALVPQIDGFTDVHFAGHGFMYICGDNREMYFRRGSSGVACAKSLTGVVVGFHDEDHAVPPCRGAVRRAADALRELDM